MIDVWQYYEYALNSEYAMVLNMLGSHMVLNKISHNRYLTLFWICLESSEYASVTQGSVEHDPSYMFDRVLIIPWVLNILGLEYTWVLNIAR